VELLTYRREAHSTSDDPSQYRSEAEADAWPGGDPVERLKLHLIGLGEWSDEAHRDLDAALEQEMAATFEHAEAYGTHAKGLQHAPESLFDDVYETLPTDLQRQRAELHLQPVGEEDDEVPTLPFSEVPRRAVG
jgi:2-oxoisovalerate dehydrogenase E1 component alpha subunit